MQGLLSEKYIFSCKENINLIKINKFSKIKYKHCYNKNHLI
jgi:hypothetical protein